MGKNNKDTFRVESFGSDGNETFDVQYGMHWIEGVKNYYFSITGSIDGRYEGYCACHDEIAKFAPRLKPLIKWHLCDQSGVPMHYVANSVYWFEKIGKPKERSYDPDALEAFKNTCVFGVLPSDVMPKDNVEQWLNNRLPMLRLAFDQDMKKFGVEYIF